jgi:hypothetical protein
LKEKRGDYCCNAVGRSNWSNHAMLDVQGDISLKGSIAVLLLLAPRKAYVLHAWNKPKPITWISSGSDHTIL